MAKVNNIRRINKFHNHINKELVNNGLYLSCGESLHERKKRNKNKFFFPINYIYLFLDFIYKRVIPKIPFLKHIYFIITRGHNRVLTKTELLGRLISCGFEIVEYFEYKNIFYIISKKNSEPTFDKQASYGVLFKMRRVGYQGNIIHVYKIRTMHPYAEYCQELAIKENSLSKSGKIKNDFRVTFWGKILRRFWLDELPMIINFCKGELNIVGVRPISENYLSKYPKELQKSRSMIKPGLIPPYYSDLPKDFNEILESERKYLAKKKISPIKTDLIYFYKAFINIIFRGARSH